jgi:glycerol-3-phosphate acyltransferase PlsX
MLRIALDAMGGDNAPRNEIDGAISALRAANNRFEIALVGQERKLKSELAAKDAGRLNLSIVHAEDVVSMHDAPAAVLRTKPDSSIVRALELHRDHVVDAFVSAGNTGAVMAASTLILGRIPGVSRPTIGSNFPNEQGVCILLDVGASVDCKPQHLYEFAVMGSIYAAQIYNCENPKVGLLSVGEEDTKGNEVTLAAMELLRRSNLNFIGNVEGRDILKGKAEVIVCDGFTGNIVLKFAESVTGLLKKKIKDYAAESLPKKIMAGIISGPLRKILGDMDYQKHGGVPLLGVNGVTIIGHGRSTPLAISNMILKAEEMALKKVNERIANALRPSVKQS